MMQTLQRVLVSARLQTHGNNVTVRGDSEAMKLLSRVEHQHLELIHDWLMT